ncbi:MAG: response regulator [Candidatus Gastranaerophilales bacterium]|nr:response regulator [Candidatus Gastranaerophilales bacterium]
MTSLNHEQAEKLFNLAGLEIPSEINSNNITKALIEIEKKVTHSAYSESNFEPETSPDILIIDDLEVSIYQLNLLLTKSGYNVCVARSVDEALDQFKKQCFEYVLLDLYIPEAEDGLKILESLNNSDKAKEDDTKIIVISGTDNKDLINKCLEKGANEFISKSPDWHKNILRHLKQLESQKHNKNKIISNHIENQKKNIVTVSINHLYNQKIAIELEKEFIALVNSGYFNIILDMSKFSSIDSKGIGTLIFGYTSCFEHGGNLKLINVNNTVKDTLSYVHLQNIIQFYKDKQSALESF